MKTILVPTDFSDAAFNAAVYAVELAHRLGNTSIILYHSNMLPTRAAELPLLHQHTKENLELFRERLYKLDKNTSIATENDEQSITAGIERICAKQKINLIIMSTTGKGNLERMFVGSNTIAVARECTVPLLLVPPKAKFTEIKKVALATDMKDTQQTLPVEIIERFIDLMNSKLLLFNVINSKDEQSKEAAKAISESFKQKPEFRFAEASNVYDGIFDFASSNDIQCLIVVRKKHSFFEKLIHNRVSEDIAFHTHLPVLLLQQHS